MKKVINNNKGFTLVELIIAMAVLAIVGTMFAVATTTAYKITKDSEQKNVTREQVIGKMDSVVSTGGTTTNTSDVSVTVTFPDGIGTEVVQCTKSMDDSSSYYIGVIQPK